jgi:hypothetical protein
LIMRVSVSGVIYNQKLHQHKQSFFSRFKKLEAKYDKRRVL